MANPEPLIAERSPALFAVVQLVMPTWGLPNCQQVRADRLFLGCVLVVLAAGHGIPQRQHALQSHALRNDVKADPQVLELRLRVKICNYAMKCWHSDR